MRHPRSVAASCVLVTGLALGACGDPFGLPRPFSTNFVDTVSLYALGGTPVAAPSGYSLQLVEAVRVDLLPFDFAFEIDSAGRALLLPTGALRLGRGSGVQLTTQPFDSIRLAPTGGYQLDSAVVIDSGSVALVRSRPTGCSFDPTPAYFYHAKLEVLLVDTVARRLDFTILVDVNCGHRGLDPPPPTAPMNLVATAVSASQVDLSWDDNATNEDGFRIERCAGVSCNGFAEIAQVAANVEGYQSTGLTASTSYSYRVRAYNRGGTSAYSNIATDTTSAPGLAPRAQ